MKKIFFKFISSISIGIIIINIIITPVIAIENINKENKSGIERFNEYIAALDHEKAQMILNDEELVITMQMDKYWYPEESSLIQPSGLVSLPLSNYPVGSFYTVNGLSCSCHSTCNWHSGSTARCLKSDSTYGNCIKYNGTNSIQCKAFADYVYKQYTGYDVSIIREFGALSDITQDTNGRTRLAEFFGNLTVGSNVRGHLREKTFSHSFIVIDKSGSGVTVYDANFTDGSGTDNCKVKQYTKTWAQMADLYDYFSNSWFG